MCLPFEELVSAEVEEVSIDKEKKRHSRIIYRFGGRKAIILFKLRKMTGRKHYQRRSLLLMKIHLCINPEKKMGGFKINALGWKDGSAGQPELNSQELRKSAGSAGMSL